MRRIITGAGVLALLLLSTVASAQTTEITFRNETGVTIYFLYASPASADTWGQDLLGNRVLEAGSTYRARVRGGGPRFDVRAIDSNENEYIVWEWNAEEENAVRITQETFVGSGASIRTGDALAWLDVVNETTYEIRELWISPASAADWESGVQKLEDWERILHGEDYRVEIDVDRFDTYIYDVMLIDNEGDRYIKWDVNLELATEVEFTLDDIVWE